MPPLETLYYKTLKHTTMNQNVLTQPNVLATSEFALLLKALNDGKCIRAMIANEIPGNDILEGSTTYREELLTRINGFIDVCAMYISERLAK